jgi:ABC-2 type transport system permease protein
MPIKLQLIAFYTIIRKEITRFMRIWVQTILPPAITMTLYFIIFGKLIGSQIRPIEGFTYMQYIVPGLVMMSVVTNAYTNVVSSFYGARFSKAIEEMIVSPVPEYLMLLGYVVGGVMRALIVSIVVIFISLFFTHLYIHNFLIMLAVIILSATLFSLAGFINGLFAKKFDDIAIIPTFVLTPLTYLGGVFYSIAVLPPFWQKVSLLNPILYMVNAFRYGILGVTDINLYWAMVVIVLFTVLLFFINLVLLRKGVGIRT